METGGLTGDFPKKKKKDGEAAERGKEKEGGRRLDILMAMGLVLMLSAKDIMSGWC